MMDQVQQASIATPLSLQQRVTAALCALMLGSFLVFGVSMANSDTLHNAAHDGRHAFAFPCH